MSELPKDDGRAQMWAQTKRRPIPPEVSIAVALSDAEKALSVLFTMLRKVAPQGAEVADEVRAHVRRAQKDFKQLVSERLEPVNDQESVK